MRTYINTCIHTCRLRRTQCLMCLTGDCASIATACMPSWLTKPMTHSLGGTLYNNCSSQATCLQCCLAISSCVGVDLDSFFVPAQCFIYSNSMAFTSSQSSTTVTQYQLINRCASQIGRPISIQEAATYFAHFHTYKAAAREDLPVTACVRCLM